jgi:PAS domain S-box-containing protein/putative nucleotidyltransferase with HDIG domain
LRQPRHVIGRAPRGSEERYRQLFERSPLPMWVYNTKTLRILAVNDAAVARYGYSRSEFCTMAIREIQPPEEWPRLEAVLQGPREARQQSGPWKHIRKDGTQIDVEILSGDVSFSVQPARLVVAIDITDRLHAETERYQAEEKYRRIFENATEEIFQTTPGGQYITANPAAARMLGFESPEELIAHHDNLEHGFYVKPGRRLEFVGLVEKEGEVSGFESEVYRKDGSTIWISEHSKAIRDEDGTVLYYQGTAQDVTARKLAEEALRTSNEQLEALFQTAPVGVVVLDRGGTVRRWNPTNERIFGWTEAEVLGQSLPYMLEEERAEDEALRERVLGGESISGVEARRTRKDGLPIFIGRYAAPLRDAQGQVTGVLELNVDITDRREKQEQLQAAETRYRLLVERIPAITYIAAGEPPYQLLYISPQVEKLLGFSTEEWLAEPGLWSRQLHPDDRERVLAEDTASREQQRPAVSEYRILAKDRHVVWLHDETHHFDEPGMAPFSQGVEFDITERKQAEERLQQQVRHMAALRRIDAAISGTFDLKAMLSLVLDDILQVLEVDAAAVSLLARGSMTLEVANAKGFHTRQIETSPLVLSADAGIKLMLEQRVIGMSDLQIAAEAPGRQSLMAAERFIFYSGIPLVSKGHIRGLLEVFDRSTRPRGDDWLRQLDALATQTAIAVDNASMFQNLQRSNVDLARAYEATIEGWSRALDLRDRETEGHTLRVTEETLNLARFLGVRQIDLSHMRRGALLHDIGKISVPDSILLKPGPLTEEEWAVMRSHPDVAYKMLSPIAYLAPALDIPYCHHEKWDGSGYPRGLKGEQIPLAARIFAVVDVWDALSSERPYRQAWAPEKVIEHLRYQSGTHFDPRVLDAFLHLVVDS